MKILNKKIAILLPILILFVSTCTTKKNIVEPESREGITLNWKVSKNDTIVYKTIMEQIGESEFKINPKQFFSSMLKFVPDSISIAKTDSLPSITDSLFNSDIFKELREMNQHSDMKTYLAESNVFEGIIDVEMIRREVNENNDSLKKIGFSDMLTGTQLKGTIHPNGSIHSFWLNNAQKNLISLFFELPKMKIKVGDVWSLQNLNYIQYGNIFNCEKAEKTNEVKLTGIRNIDNDKIAIIEYNIHEFVSGKIEFFGSIIPSQMEVSFKAKSEFSVNKGKWVSYFGLLTVKSNGMMNSNSSQKFVLIEI